MIRYFMAIFWVSFLCLFSYTSLIVLFIVKGYHCFVSSLTSNMQDDTMLLTNIGMVGMLFVDSFITGIITKRHEVRPILRLTIFLSAILALVMTIFTRIANEQGWLLQIETFTMLEFCVFILLLIIHKAESLCICHYSDNNSIKPSLQS